MRDAPAVKSRTAVIAGAMMAVILATATAVLGAIIGWNTAAGFPDDSTADHIARQAIPGMGTETQGTRHLFIGEDMEGDPDGYLFNLSGWDEYGPGYLRYELEHSTQDSPDLRESRERLTTAGWDIADPSAGPGSAGFTAIRDDLTLNISTIDDTSGPGSTTVTIYLNTPTQVPPLTAVGLVVGGLAGWFLTVRIRRRATQWSPPQRIAAANLLGIGGVLLALPTVLCLFRVAESLTNPAERIPVWIGYIWGPLSIVTLLGATALTAAPLCGRIPLAGRQPSEPSR